ncbi:hypothetical protein BJ944DRAFT_265813 [Cunninghamella echinulata]|nr:hypothetical protein BJ944DRAFT_265813 [Cunninghamella echinulata]
MVEDATSSLSNGEHVLPDQTDTTNSSNEVDNRDTSETSSTFIRYPPLIFGHYPALAIHDIEYYECGYKSYKVLCRNRWNGTMYYWVSADRINAELLKEFEERVRKDFGYDIGKNNHNLNIYNNRSKRQSKLRAMLKISTSKAYGTDLDSSDEEFERKSNIKLKKRKRKSSSSKKPIVKKYKNKNI